ncbi:MAG: adenosylcobinamide-GDP ribazoletransferase, partial [Butyricicoccus sp.]|nr:adenosylcobinamide-GDP ribazoletransferase [Butyricicoccus sp.]
PVPQVRWEKKTMRWALCFLPLIGAVVGLLEWAWLAFALALKLTELLYAVVAALIPIAVTGGIHLDGLTDTCDALCSHADREKKLEILKDPHVGAFGVMWQTACLLLTAALFSQVYTDASQLPILCLGYVAARALGGRAIVALPCAKNSGLAYIFADQADKTIVRRVLFAVWGICCAAMIVLRPACGVVFTILSIIWLLIYRRICMRVFGGMTGDLAGFLITTTELLALGVTAFGGVLV